MNTRDLIFDIGLHKGFDTQYYLQKGFRVVGLEAAEALCEQARTLNKSDIAAGRLTIVQKALNYSSGQIVDFFINPEKDDWGSLFKGAAEKGVGTATQIQVETVTLADLIRDHGLPYYIKCDIEGGDAIFVEQLLALPEKPPFVSIEATDADDIAKLRACGYDRFQLINQYMNPWTIAPDPSREGTYVAKQFTHEMSGLFGRDLDPKGWKKFETVIKMFSDFYYLKNNSENLAVGWLDIHATRDCDL